MPFILAQLCTTPSSRRVTLAAWQLSALTETVELLFSELSRKWGRRRTASGKIVRFVLDQP